MTKTNRYNNADGAQRLTDASGIDPNDREQLLDDLQFEVSRLADAVERQNELLEQLGTKEIGRRRRG
jgi:hypothetical protein